MLSAIRRFLDFILRRKHVVAWPSPNPDQNMFWVREDHTIRGDDGEVIGEWGVQKFPITKSRKQGWKFF